MKKNGVFDHFKSTEYTKCYSFNNPKVDSSKALAIPVLDTSHKIWSWAKRRETITYKFFKGFIYTRKRINISVVCCQRLFPNILKYKKIFQRSGNQDCFKYIKKKTANVYKILKISFLQNYLWKTIITKCCKEIKFGYDRWTHLECYRNIQCQISSGRVRG